MDLQHNTKVVTALAPVDWDTDAEGLLIDCRGFSGQAVFYLTAIEDASLAASKKLDVTIHNVADNDEAPVAGNKVAAFTQIVGQNDLTPDAITEQIGVQLGALDPAKPYLQILGTETSTWEGLITIVAVLGGAAYGPAHA